MSLQHIHLEGNLFTSDHLARVQGGDKELGGLAAADYGVKRRLDEEIGEAYNRLERAWGFFKLKRRIESNDPEAVTDEWVSEVWRALGGGPLFQRPLPQIEGKTYPIRFEWEGIPIHVVPFDQELERGPRGDARGNPHSTLQEYLNRRENAFWGILTNGDTLRILRDNANSTRPAYVEFDLKGMMESQSFAEFGLFWRMCHYTRFLNGQDCWLEQWMRESANRGTPARDLLRGAVENALLALGRGFLRHPRNKALRQRLQKGELSPDDYYRQLLRLVYRLIFLFVTEDRGLLLDPKSSPEAKELYAKYYSTRRLRTLAQTVRGTRHHDLYESVKVVMDGLKDAKGKPALALPPLNSDLWSRTFIPDLDPAEGSEKAETGYLENRDLLAAIHDLSRIRLERGEYRTVDYRNLGADELGSIYESLLELEPSTDVEARAFNLIPGGGGERKTTGSHYTPQNLIDEVLDHALDPLLDEAEKAESPEKAILELTVCDPTCGSGHFLIAAAHRMAKRLARLRTGDPEPAPGDLRRALRDVIGRCIYGVDINPMSVELCKVSLWLESMEPGKPLAYLEHHIKCGNALLGASPEYLERGIPEEAYKPRPKIDDKDTCKKLVKINREFPMNTTTLSNFRSDRKRVQDTLSAALDRIEQMPTTTVAEVEAKDAEYRRTFVETDEYERYKHAMDAWCAAFSYEKKQGRNQKHLTNIELVDFLHPDAHVDRDTIELIEAEQRKEKNHFFHWSLEFPAVFSQGGFDAIVGNPPYMGGGKVRDRLGPHYLHYLTSVFTDYSTLGDLAGSFLLKFSGLAKHNGFIGVITTNAIAKGNTRSNALEKLVAAGKRICFARPDIEWVGEANVVVSLVVLTTRPIRRTLRDKVVEYISSRLDDLPESDLEKISERVGKAFVGDQPSGDGFLLTPSEASAAMQRSPALARVLFPYITAEDLMQTPNAAASRWVICFHKWSEEEARRFPWAYDRVRERVKPFRDTVARTAHRKRWWQFGEYRQRLRDAINELDFVIVRPMVSETPLFVRLPNKNVFSNKLVVIAADSPSLLGILNSGINEVWFRRTGGGMKHDIVYSPACFETLPGCPDSSAVAAIGSRFDELVNRARVRRKLALTPFWNLVNSPDCREPDVAEVRALRDELTVAVAKAYSMEIDFRFGHYKDHADRWRYTMHPEAAEQVYLKLVELNARQATTAPTRSLSPRDAIGQTKLSGPRQVRLGE